MPPKKKPNKVPGETHTKKQNKTEKNLIFF